LAGVEQRMFTEQSRIRRFIVFCDWLSIPVLDVVIKSLGFDLLAVRNQLECLSAIKGGAVQLSNVRFKTVCFASVELASHAKSFGRSLYYGILQCGTETPLNLLIKPTGY
jgi:hypothetical protein